MCQPCLSSRSTPGLGIVASQSPNRCDESENSQWEGRSVAHDGITRSTPRDRGKTARDRVHKLAPGAPANISLGDVDVARVFCWLARHFVPAEFNTTGADQASAEAT